ncbi:MAG TPA: hypothetical protein VIK91_09755 [Nannocystis sp.]
MYDRLIELAAAVAYQDLRAYLEARGWNSFPSRVSYAAIYRSPGASDFEVQIPLDTDLADYADAIVLAARRIAAFEDRPIEQVLRDLLQPRCDTVRYAVTGPSTRTGTISLVAGHSLVSGALKSLLASACSVQRPRRFHPRMTLADAESFVRACRLGQTEIGSYVLTVEAPLDIHTQLDTTELPFGRRATTYLFESTAYLARAIRHGETARLLDETPGAPLVSANLCESLVEMMPPDESADLRLTGSWSPLIPAPASVPSAVHFDRTMFEAVERLAQQLRPSCGSEPAQFVGKVVELSGAPNPVGELEGDVVLQVQADDQLLKVRVPLGPGDYRKAGAAHLAQHYVSVRGQLHRGPRTHVLKDPTDFQVLRP